MGRGYVDAQNASAWHKVWPGQGNSLFVPMPGKATSEQLAALQRSGVTAGLRRWSAESQGQRACSAPLKGSPARWRLAANSG